MKLLLKYSPEALNKPILAQVIRQTKAEINLLHAEVDATKGMILVGVEASPEEVERIERMFEERGVRVERLEHMIKLDEGMCMSCGACISLCPVEALWMDEDYSVKLREEKCILCEACIPACPVKAIEIKKPGP